MTSLALAIETPEAVYERLLAAGRGDPIEDTLARILASWSLGLGAMPAWLGLGEAGFRQMLARHFPAWDPMQIITPGRPVDPRRLLEVDDLEKLLAENLSGRSNSEAWMVKILTAGCLGDDHLWQDLGLWSRNDLSKLMWENFEPLARRNDKDMKWKKFLYKQLCEAEGLYICRAPSCGVCADYHDCFGPEE